MLFMMISMLLTTINVSAASCEQMFAPELLQEIKNILTIIQVAAPILLLFFTSLDFAKVVFGNGKDGMDKAKNNFLKRSVAVLIVFFAPMIVKLILDLVQENSLRGCIDVIS